MLTEHELVRYNRQILLDGWGVEGQEKLKNTTVFVAGAGGTGSPTIVQLALLGVGCIKICDFDTFDIPNMNRQFIHMVDDEERIGMNKAFSAARTVHNINPHVKVEVYENKFTEENIDDMVGDSQMIFDCVDKFEPKFVLSRCAIRKKIPHLFSGIFDINTFACIFYPPITPCFHCIFDYGKMKVVNEMAHIRANKGMSIFVSSPTLFASTGFIVGEGVKILLGHGEPAYNKYILFMQKGNNRAAKTMGYEGMRFWNTNFFDEQCLSQGFDWDKGWRGNLFEALDIKANPDCEYCKDTHMGKAVNIQIEEVGFDFDF